MGSAGTPLASQLCCSIGSGAALLLFSPAGTLWTVLTAMVLGFAAAADWSERRVPRRAMSVGGALVGLVIVAVCGIRCEWMTLARSGAPAVVVLTALGWLWWSRPSAIGLGDVKAVGLAVASAAAVSWQALLNIMFATALAGVVVVGWFTVGRCHGPDRISGASARRWEATVPLVPALCAGFVVGVGVS